MHMLRKVFVGFLDEFEQEFFSSETATPVNNWIALMRAYASDVGNDSVREDLFRLAGSIKTYIESDLYAECGVNQPRLHKELHGIWRVIHDFPARQRVITGEAQDINTFVDAFSLLKDLRDLHQLSGLKFKQFEQGLQKLQQDYTAVIEHPQALLDLEKLNLCFSSHLFGRHLKGPTGALIEAEQPSHQNLSPACQQPRHEHSVEDESLRSPDSEPASATGLAFDQ